MDEFGWTFADRRRELPLEHVADLGGGHRAVFLEEPQNGDEGFPPLKAVDDVDVAERAVLMDFILADDEIAERFRFFGIDQFVQSDLVHHVREERKITE